MTKFPCPSCGKQRASIEALCEGCGWSPPPASERVNDPRTDIARQPAVSYFAGPLGGVVGMLLAGRVRLQFEFAEGWLAAIICVMVCMVTSRMLFEAVVYLATEIAIWTSNDRHSTRIYPKYSETRPTSSKPKI
jgi:hypothetical protein